MDKEKLERSVENAEVMLAFCAERGIDIPEDFLNVIVDSRSKLKAHEELGSLESRFWIVYTHLSKKIYPVTIESLRTVNLKLDHHSKSFVHRLFAAKSVAHESVNAYRILGLIVMVIMLLVQIYWVVGAKLVSDINTVIPQELTNLRKQKTERQSMLGDQAAMSYEIADLESKLEELGNKLMASSVAVKKWNEVWQTIIPISADTTTLNLDPDELYIEDYLEVKYASFALDAIKEYLLPLLYGLLGAFAFIFRDIFIEIKNKTFTQESTIKYILRLHLGALTGLAVGWFFGNDSTQHYFTISNLSPLALSFLSGYGVEILFAGMDRLISAFADDKSSRHQTTQPSSNGQLTRNEIKDLNKNVELKPMT